MKKKLSLLLITISIVTYGNEIDKLKTTEQVRDFIVKLNPHFTKNKYRNFLIKSTDSIAKNLDCDGIFKNWKIKNWEKTDINNDGKTDLVFVSYWYSYQTYSIIDNGNEKYDLHRLSKHSFDECEFVKPIKLNGKNYLKIYQKKKRISDTLTFKYNSFLELESKKADYQIESVQIDKQGLYGMCAFFSLKLFKENDLIFLEKKCKYEESIRQNIALNKFKEITEVLEYINVKKLKDNYSVGWFDDHTIILTVVFKDGTTKKIKDYGLQGSFGLSAFYNKFMKLNTEIKSN